MATTEIIKPVEPKPKTGYIIISIPWRKKEIIGNRVKKDGTIVPKYDHFCGLPISENIYERMNPWERNAYKKRWYEIIAQRLVVNGWRLPMGPLDAPVKFRITIWVCGQEQDRGNPSDKAILDGFKQAGVIEDDNPSIIPDRTQIVIKKVKTQKEQKTDIECYNILPPDAESDEYVGDWEI